MAEDEIQGTIPRRRDGGRALALVPIGVCLLMFALMMPRATAPEAVPMPHVDPRALAAVRAHDDDAAAQATAKRLPGDVLAIGEGLREVNESQARGDDEAAGAAANARLDGAIRALAPRDGLVQDLVALRSVQLARFLAEVRGFERTGETSPELAAIGGAFVRRMRDAGWVEGNRVLLDEDQRRVAFKLMWNALTRVDSRSELQLGLDEQRVLYTLYLERPHVSDRERPSIDAQLGAATSPEACARAHTEESRSTELWRADKIRRLGGIDPDYPMAYALGVAYYRAGKYELAIDAFRSWTESHPDGPYSLVARNHLKAALAAANL